MGVFPEDPCKYITGQIYLTDEVDSPSTYSELLSDMNPWLDNRRDQKNP